MTRLHPAMTGAAFGSPALDRKRQVIDSPKISLSRAWAESLSTTAPERTGRSRKAMVENRYLRDRSGPHGRITLIDKQALMRLSEQGPSMSDEDMITQPTASKDAKHV